MDKIVVDLRWRTEKRAKTKQGRTQQDRKIYEAINKAVNDALFPLSDVQGWTIRTED